MSGTPFKYGSPIMCQCSTPTTKKMAINPKMIAPTMPKDVRRLAINSPIMPTRAAMINQMIKSASVITMNINLLVQYIGYLIITRVYQLNRIQQQKDVRPEPAKPKSKLWPTCLCQRCNNYFLER